jgi:hypothetical protein
MWEANLNSFSSLKRFGGMLITAALVCLTSQAQAIVISGIYTGSCQRKLGVILGVNSYNLKLLTLDGVIETFPRYQVVQLVTYAVEGMPFSAQVPAEISLDAVSAFQVSTLVNLNERTLVTGYPIDFSNEKIAFLTKSGREVLIDKMNVARLEKLDSFVIQNESRKSSSYSFGHSYAFESCDMGNLKNSIYPDQILSDALTIKRELDRLQRGFETVDSFLDEQSFYSKPLIYENKTRLGMWQSFGSRYGKSKNRTNDFTPILNTEYASDIYSYQRIFSTGSQPNPLFEHEEAQTQALYAFKASYFHALAYLDPNLILTGKNYDFTLDDLENGDVKFSSKLGMGLGFDFGRWQIGFVAGTVQMAVSDGTSIYGSDVALSKLHLTYTDFKNSIELLAGAGETSNVYGEDEVGVQSGGIVNLEMKHLRLNYRRNFADQWKGLLSYISNSYSVKSIAGGGDYTADSTSISAMLQHSFSKRFSVEGLLSVEKFESAVLSKTYPKGGASIHLFF